MDGKIFPAVLIAACVSVVLMMALRPIAVTLGLVDKPGGRKRHVGHVPIIGGVAMFFGFSMGALLVPTLEWVSFLLVGSVLIVAIGLIDDRHDLPASVRFGAQFVAVLVMYFGASVGISTLGRPLGSFELLVGSFSLPLTVLVACAVINAINMSDGMDGLAGGMALIALAGFAAVGYGTPIFGVAVIGAVVVLVFLVFNFPVKTNRSIRTFMGDAGSTFLGYLIAWLGIQACQPPIALVSPVVVLGLVSVPLFDLTSCFFRRIMDKRSPFSADRNHFHHVLQEAGLRRRQILAVLLGINGVIAMASLVAFHVGATDRFLFMMWCCFGLATDFGLRRYRSLHDRRMTSRAR